MKNKDSGSKSKEGPAIDPEAKAVSGQRKAVKIDPRTFCFGWERAWGNVEAILERHANGAWVEALHEIDSRFPSFRDPYGNDLLGI